MDETHPEPDRPLRIAALVKQIPAFEAMQLGEDGRLVREGLSLEMSAYCRRAVAEAVLLVEKHGGSVDVITLGPPAAEDVLREAIAYGSDRGVAVHGLHVSDAAFAGSDTLATAQALAAAIGLLESEAGPFDLVLCGRNSVDADTGQVGPELAELLDLPFATGVKELALEARRADALVAHVGCELDDLWQDATVELPALLSTAERLIDPCKIKEPTVWAGVDGALVRRVGANDLGEGPWGQEASPTWVGEVRLEQVDRAGIVLDGPVERQVAEAAALLDDRGVLVPGTLSATSDAVVPEPTTSDDGASGSPKQVVVVVLEPDRDRLGAELLGAAARLAEGIGGRVVAVTCERPSDAQALGALGADAVVAIEGVEVEEDVSTALLRCMRAGPSLPWAVLVGGTPWGREVASRAAAATGSGLTGDAVGLAVEDGRLLAWKPAFGGALVAAIRASSTAQMATVRAGVLALRSPRARRDVPVEVIDARPRRRVVVRSRRFEDRAEGLATAEMVIGVGQGIAPERYGELEGLLLGAELAATRKVTDNGWMPHARQLGITGHSISPRLYIAIGTSGKYNHAVGVRSAGTVLAINPDPSAPIFGFADIGLVAPWEDVVPELHRQLTERMRRHA